MTNFGKWVARGASVAAVVVLAGCAGGLQPSGPDSAAGEGPSRAVIAVDPGTPDNLETHNGH